jgi:glutaredoxin-like protein
MPDHSSTHPITVFWRPGCGFCAALLRGLDKSGLANERANIWDDKDAAAYVRSVARGNETVPTVRIGDTALVNPSAQQVLATVATEAPEQLPDGYVPPQPGRLGQMVSKLLGGQPLR